MKWETYKLKQLCSEIVDCVNKTAPTSDVPTPYKMLRTSDIRDGKINLENLNCVTKEVYEKWTRRGKLQKGDVIFTREAPLGEVGLVREEKNYFLGQRLVLFRANNKMCDGRFLMYSLLWRDNKQAIISKGVGSTVAHLRVPECENIEIKVPDLDVQHRIADILSAYDDLIENNQKQIKLLEEAAQRLYKEWFVDLHFPGHENTKIVDGLPEGWQYEKLGDLVKTTSGGTPSRRKSEYYVNGNIRWIKTKELNDRFIFETEEHITEDAVKNSSAKVLPEGALIVAMYGATIGKIGITAAEMACNQACCAFISFDDMISKEYLYCWLMDNREYLVSQGKGAAQSNLSQEMIRNFSLLCPDKKVIKNFTEIVTTMLENKRVLENKILMLSKARDDLLPKLMSEEVEV